MTIPSSGTISLFQINGDNSDGFSLGTSLNAYRGQIYDKKDGTVGVFSSGAISFSDFYGKRRVDGNATGVSYTSAGSSTYTIPAYKTITLVIKGSGGGGGGGAGGSANTNFCNGGAGSPGSDGNTSSFGNVGNSYRTTAAGGTKGFGGGYSGGGPAPNGAAGSDATGYDGTPSRASGGAAGSGGVPGSGGSGGGGGKTTATFTNPVLGGTGPTSGSSVPYVIGAGGAGGGLGTGFKFDPYGGCVGSPGNSGGPGSAGSDGSLTITWTGT
jgi:hypothetical protein